MTCEDPNSAVALPRAELPMYRTPYAFTHQAHFRQLHRYKTLPR